MWFGTLIGAVLITAGVLYWFGRPSPKRPGYWLTLGLPALVALAAVIMLLIVGPPG